jgi:flagella basal body P-ring formation protein FlgA
MTGKRQTITLVAAVVLLMISPPQVFAQRCEIRLHESAVLAAGGVSLSDIAELAVDNADMKERLHNLVVAQLSQDASDLSVGSFEITRALARAGINPAAVDIYGASSCRLNLKAVQPSVSVEEPTPAVAVSPSRSADANGPSLTQELTATVARALDLPPAKLVADWFCNDPEVLAQASEPNRYEIIPRSTISLGRVQFELRDRRNPKDRAPASSSSRSSTAIRVSGNVQYLCTSVVAARPLQNGDIIQAADIKLLPRRVSSFADMGLTDDKGVIGQEVLHSIPVHAPILPAMIKRLQLIKRKDHVELCYRSGPVQVRLRGEALGEGAYGDSISVRNLMTNTILRGQITGPGEVTLAADDGVSGVHVAQASTSTEPKANVHQEN